MDAHVDWSGVRDRVIAVREAELRAAGRHSECPVFEPALTAAEIAEVEAQYGVELPGEYRSFLAEVAAGGPGPEISLTSLCRVEGRWAWVWHGFPWVLDPSGPFVETRDWAGEQVKTLRAAGYEPTIRDADLDYLPDYRKAFGSEVGEEAWHLQRDRGAFQVGDSGCGMTSYLIVIGPHRGELRFRDCAVNPPYEAIVDARGRLHTFYTWYMDWLDRCEAKVRQRGTTSYPAVTWFESATRPGVFVQRRTTDKR